MSLVQTDQLPSVVNEELLAHLKSAIEQFGESLSRQDAERSIQKEIVDNLFEKHQFPKKSFRQMAKLKYQGDVSNKLSYMEEFNEFVNSYIVNDND